MPVISDGPQYAPQRAAAGFASTRHPVTSATVAESSAMVGAAERPIRGVAQWTDTSFQTQLDRASRPSRRGRTEGHARGLRRRSRPLREILAVGRRPAARLVEMRGDRDDHGRCWRSWPMAADVAGAPRRDVRRREDQHHRGPRRAAHRAARARAASAVIARRPRRHARRPRRARRHGGFRRRRALRQGARRHRQEDHRHRQYRHRRLRPRPGHGDAGAGALSRRAARPFRLQHRRRPYRTTR